MMKEVIKRTVIFIGACGLGAVLGMIANFIYQEVGRGKPLPPTKKTFKKSIDKIKKIYYTINVVKIKKIN